MADVGEALGLKGLTHIAVDGKSLRGATGNTFTGCVHVVTAWANEHGLVLGQEVAADQSNEIPAFPALLNTRKLTGALVTINAAGGQTDVADAIRDGLLAVKGNGPGLLAAAEAVFADATEKEFSVWEPRITRRSGTGTGGTRSGARRPSRRRTGCCRTSGGTWRRWCR